MHIISYISVYYVMYIIIYFIYPSSLTDLTVLCNQGAHSNISRGEG